MDRRPFGKRVKRPGDPQSGSKPMFGETRDPTGRDWTGLSPDPLGNRTSKELTADEKPGKTIRRRSKALKEDIERWGDRPETEN